MQSICDEIKQLENKVIDIKKRRTTNNNEKLLLDIMNNFRYAINKIKKDIELLDKAEEEKSIFIIQKIMEFNESNNKKRKLNEDRNDDCIEDILYDLDVMLNQQKSNIITKSSNKICVIRNNFSKSNNQPSEIIDTRFLYSKIKILYDDVKALESNKN